MTRREHSDVGANPAAFSSEFQYWDPSLQCNY
jgi:hypothetical protein